MVKKEEAILTAGAAGNLKNSHKETKQGHWRKTTMPLFCALHVAKFNSKPCVGLIEDPHRKRWGIFPVRASIFY
jgi:hypothetical protein